MKHAYLVIYRSQNGRDNWTPVEQKDVPAWVNEPRTIGRLIAGEACMKADDGSQGSDWYKAKRVVPGRVMH
jgi:hypothetical protein